MQLRIIILKVEPVKKKNLVSIQSCTALLSTNALLIPVLPLALPLSLSLLSARSGEKHGGRRRRGSI